MCLARWDRLWKLLERALRLVAKFPTRLEFKVAWARNTRFESVNEDVKYEEKDDRNGEFDKRPRK